MEDKGFSDVSFSKGVTTSLWSGYFNQANPLVPQAFSPFFSSKIFPLSTKQFNCLLVLSLVLNGKMDQLKSFDKIKSLCKADVMVPTNYHSFCTS
jgi:hypothetical protein